MLLLTAVKDLLRHRTSILLLLSVMITATITTAFITSAGYSTSHFRNVYRSATSPVDIIVRFADGRFFNQTLVTNAIRNVRGVEAVSGRVQISQMYRFENGTRRYANLIALQHTDLELGNYSSVKTYVMLATRVVLSYDLYLSLYNFGKYNSSRLYLIDPLGQDHNVTVGGALDPGLFQLWIRNAIFLDIVEAQKIVGADQVNLLVVRLTDFLTSSNAATQISQKLGPAFSVTDMRAGITEQVRADQDEVISLMRIPLSFEVIFATSFFLATLFLNIRAREGDLATFRVLGATRGQLLRLFTYESLLIGTLGSILGSIFGVFLPILVFSALGEQSFSSLWESFLSWSNLTAVSFAGVTAVAVTVAGVLIPIMIHHQRSLNSPPDAKVKRLRRYSWAPALGAIVFVTLHPYPISEWVIPLDISVLVVATTILISRSGQFTRRLTGWVFGSRSGVSSLVPSNLRRNLGRNIVAVSLLALAISFVVLTNGVESSLSRSASLIVERHFGADIIAKPVLPTSADYTRQLSLNSGVAETTPVYATTVTFRKYPLAIVAIDPLSFPKLVTLGFEGQSRVGPYQRLSREPFTALIARPLLNIFSQTYGQELGVNSSIPIPFTKGVTNVTIAGVVSAGFFYWMALNGVPLALSIFISYDSLLSIAPETQAAGEVSFFLIKVADGVPINYLAQRLRANAGDAFQFFSAKDIEENAATELTSLYLGMQFMAALSIAMATVSAVIVASADLIERRYEIGLFKILGMTRRQSLLLFVGETLFGVILGLFIGILSGIALLSEVIAFTSRHLPIRLAFSPLSLGELLLVTLTPAFLGTLLVVRRITNVPAFYTLRAKPIQPLDFE